MSKLPHVLMIHTGGTLMMRPGDDDRILQPDVYARDLLAELPVLRSIASIDTRILFNLDSGDMQPSHWVEIAQCIHESLDEYDGIVVITGTDTMAFTASALAFLLPGLDRSKKSVAARAHFQKKNLSGKIFSQPGKAGAE